MSLEAGFASQTPSLPTGGGSVGGLGETFVPDLCTGTGTFSVPLDLPNGPNDIGPKLSLRYDSGSPNGPFGLGWMLPLPRILRTTMRGRPRFSASDELVLEGSGPLVPLPDGSLRPQVDTGDWRIEVLAGSGGVRFGEAGFLVTDRAGNRFRLGVSAAARIPGPAGAPWAWLTEGIEDNLGNTVGFQWRAEDAQRYLERVAYGVYRLELFYEPRPDVLRTTRGGFVLRTALRCRSIALSLAEPPSGAPAEIRRWDLGYVAAPVNGASLLSSVTLVGTAADGTTLATPPLMLGYRTPEAPRLRRMGARDEGAAPPGLDGRGRVELVDWNGDGLPDVLEVGADGSARLWPNLGGRWDRPRSIGELPQLAPLQARTALVDLDGDGLADLVRADAPLAGYQPRTLGGLARPVTWTLAPAATTLASAAVRIADFDGDGRADLLWSTGVALLLAHRADDPGGWEARPTVVGGIGAGREAPPIDLADPHVFCADMTGDGTPDLVRVDGSGVTYWPYLGLGSFGEPVRMATPPRLPFDVDPARLLVVDVDGDGCADIVLIDDGRVRWWPNVTGERFGPERTVAHLPTGAMRDVRVADLFGTGCPALCWTATDALGRAAWLALELLGGVRPNLLTSIDNGVGRRTDISYGTSACEAARDRAAGAPWSTRLPVVLSVVSALTVTDVASGQVDRTRFRYHDGRYDGALREVCGYGRVEQTDDGDADVATLVTTRWFAIGRGPSGKEPITLDERRRGRAIRGRLLRQDRGTENGSVLDRTTNDFDVEDADVAGVVVPRLRAITVAKLEGSASPVSWITTEQLRYDADGNVTETRERAFVAGQIAPTRELRTTTTYAHDPTGRFRQRVARITQTDASGAVLADTATTYDRLPEGQVGAEGLVTGRAALALTDTLVAEVYGVGPEAPDWSSLGYRRGAGGWWIDLTRFERVHDAEGLRGSVTGPNGAVTRLEFDRTGAYPARVIDARGNVVTASFDPRACQPTTYVDTAGAISTAGFDALARLVFVAEAGDTESSPTIRYRYRTDVLPVEIIVERATSNGAAAIVERQRIDGGGRLLERRGRDETGEVIDVSHTYGPRGLAVRSYLARRAASESYAPLGPDASALHVAVRYDGLGRAVRTVRPDGAVRQVSYAADRIDETDEAGRVIRRHLDETGRIIRIEQQLDGVAVTSSYVYDAKGNLLRHSEANGTTAAFTYDLLGRVVRVVRPEASQVAVLDAAGNTIEARTGSARVHRRFDPLGRLLDVRYGSPAAAPAVLCTYHDTAGPPPSNAGAHTNGGRLVRVDDEGGTTVLDYDGRGRLAHKTMTLAGPAGAPGVGTVLHVALGYRADGQVETITMPPAVADAAPLVLTHRYDARGRLAAIDGVIAAIDYDLLGRRTSTRYANGVVREDLWDAASGLTTSTKLTGPGGTPGQLRSVGYIHDLVGNLTAITSPDPELAWTYAYDGLNRLVSATSVDGTRSYAYDSAGNLTSSEAGAYAYGGGGAAATLVTSVGGEAYGWDERGHLRSAPWGLHRVDDAGQLRRIDFAAGGHEELVYGHTSTLVHRRVVGVDGAVSDTFSPDPLIRIENGVLVIQISDGERIVCRDAAGVRTWLHHDHLGSIVLATDAAGVPVASRRYGPYGRVIGGTGVLSGSAGFGGGGALGSEPHLPELVLLGARWYSPLLGRFLSPDPVVGDAMDPLAWNAYAYCRCNPTSYVDPTGRSFWKVFGMVLAAIAIIAVVVVVSVFTFGIATPGAIAIGSVTWGAVFAATMVGVAAGGVIGGIAAARAGGDAGDVLLGVLVGGAVGGWAAFGAAFAGAAVSGGFGLSGVAGGAVSGAVSGTINGAAMGFAAGFAGGKNNGFKDIMLKVLVGALVGAAVGAALGAASGIVAPKETPTQSVEKALKPDIPSAPPTGMPPSAVTPPPSSINNFGDAAMKTATGVVGKVGGALAPHAAAATAGFTGSVITQTVIVDIGASAAAGFFDDLQEYLRTHNVNLGPFNFVKSDF